MKSSCLLIIGLLLTLSSLAQQKKKGVSDTIPARLVIYDTNAIRKTRNARTPEAEITEKLNNLVGAYVSKPNTQATWTQIVGEAENLLLIYFRNSVLVGTKPEHAFFVQMGNATMTQADIANHKMILKAGIATVKPGEFKVLVIEKVNGLR